MFFSKTHVALWCVLPSILLSASQVQAGTSMIENEAALKAYEKAMELNSRAGVKKNIERLRAKLKV